MPNGTYGGVRGWGREAPAYSMVGIVTWSFQKNPIFPCNSLDPLHP